ncbi:hypothetical protein JMJ77_0011332 [Colletotrichum scovillei]|uniref:Uncharacterized protein n=1 Tax=Colletotrichum scovillei TaxID=1209932 RepID=A0A9P7UA08_9PEZI|nr:hypothetical protein JMJ77_0011332 [Colletotrichum scovillei]KAG7060310.1 hypothetical protein JMJ78_0015585 [Colletotrichum scovillei]KAG7067761.1 hypothetical protein JMJ76_0009189 [Colletotrichum scovillei]
MPIMGCSVCKCDCYCYFQVVLLLQNSSLPLPAPVQCRTLSNLRLPCSPDATIAQRLRAACILPHLDPKWSARRPSKGPVLFEVPGVKARGSNGTVNVWLFFLRQLPTRSPVRRPTTPSNPMVISRLPQFTDC